MKEKKILDPCCGGKMFWFDKKNPNVLFTDIRKEDIVLCDGRSFSINPDMISDFRDMPFKNNSFNMVVFDPPHLKRVGKKSWLAKKYGVLNKDWENDIKKGFEECFRVLKKDGVLIFKWNENQVKLNEVLNLTDKKPLFGHRTSRKGQTIWLAFMK